MRLEGSGTRGDLIGFSGFLGKAVGAFFTVLDSGINRLGDRGLTVSAVGTNEAAEEEDIVLLYVISFLGDEIQRLSGLLGMGEDMFRVALVGDGGAEVEMVGLMAVGSERGGLILRDTGSDPVAFSNVAKGSSFGDAGGS